MERGHRNSDKVQKNIVLGLHLLTLPISSYVVEGLSKIFHFEMLRHGTSIPYYFSILKNGADPTRGGTGSSAVLSNVDENNRKCEQEACKGRFHVFKDSEAVLIDGQRVPVVGHIIKRTHTHFHAVLSGLSFTQQVKNKVVRIVASIFLGIANFFSPTICFMYRKSEIYGTDTTPKIFENDPDYNNLAYYTTQKLPSDRIGLVGICKHATLADAKRAWKANPLRVISGVALLIVGIALTLIGVGTWI